MNSKTYGGRAYSYARWSTAAQTTGDSARRQRELVETFVRRHGLVLEESITDAGVSAFRGANKAKASGFARFLTAVQAGEIEPGSWLLVEDVDRISRERPEKAAYELSELVREGINVVLLRDGTVLEAGKPYDMSKALMTFVKAALAHDESVKKAERLKAAWAARRDKAKAGAKITACVPGWMRKEDDKVVLIPHRVELLRWMYQCLKQGRGKVYIVAELHRRQEPTWKAWAGEPKKQTRWSRNTIHRMLTNVALRGDLQLKLVEHDKDGKKSKTPVQLVRHYYPAVFTEDQFDELQSMLKGAATVNRNRPLQNVFSGLARCPQCGSTMARVLKSGGRRARLVCVKVTAKQCDGKSVAYEDVEQSLLEGLPAIMAHKPTPQEDLQRRADDARGALMATEGRLQDAAEEYERGPTPALAAAVRTLEADVKAARVEVDSAETAAAQADRVLTERRLKDVRSALKGNDRRALNVALRSLFESVTVDRGAGELRLRWRDGTEQSWTFGWPDDETAVWTTA